MNLAKISVFIFNFWPRDRKVQTPDLSPGHVPGHVPDSAPNPLLSLGSPSNQRASSPSRAERKATFCFPLCALPLLDPGEEIAALEPSYKQGKLMPLKRYLKPLNFVSQLEKCFRMNLKGEGTREGR